MNTIYFDSDHEGQRRREELYQGQIYVYSPSPSGLALCDLARQMCEEAFAPHDPRQAQHHLPVEDYVEILRDLKPRFIHHPDCKRFIPQLLRELGCDMQMTYFDVPRLRTATSGDYLNTGLAYAFKPHRDTWYSPPMCQINWWLPVYPVMSDNVMAFHPEYWNRPIKNSSCLFNYQVWNATGRKQAAAQVGRDTRIQSEALEPLKLEPDVRLVCRPGGVIVFSAAHLHSTVSNSSGETRFSIDFRTVDERDTERLQGAPNYDSESTGTTMMDYLRGTDLSHFPQETIDRFAQLEPSPMHPTSRQLVEAAVASS